MRGARSKGGGLRVTLKHGIIKKGRKGTARVAPAAVCIPSVLVTRYPPLYSFCHDNTSIESEIRDTKALRRMYLKVMLPRNIYKIHRFYNCVGYNN